MRMTVELADVVRRFGRDYIENYKPSGQQLKVLSDIVLCRTSELGGHEEECDCCTQVRYSYNSCGNRHCPKCLATKQAVWVDELIDNTLPVKHYHIIFTVPHELNAICLFDQRLYYKVLFSAVWHTLHSFGYTHYGVESGAVCILHSCLSAAQGFGRRRVRTFLCIRTFIALCQQLATHSREIGNTLAYMMIFFIRYSN